MSNLRLSIPKGKAYSMACTSYTIGLQSNIPSAILRNGKIHLPVKVSQQSLKVSVTLRSRTSLRLLQTFIRTYHRDLVAGRVDAMHISYVSANLFNSKTNRYDIPNPSNPRLSLYGFPVGIEGGARKFQFYPSINLTFILTQDLVSETTNKFSNSTDPDNLTDPETDITTPDNPPPNPGEFGEGSG